MKDLPFPIIAVIPGAETGVELADQLACRLNLPNNGLEKSHARRNKYVMGETVRNAGVRAVKQEVCTSVEQMVAFLDTLRAHDGSLSCVVKPVESAGTDHVYLCHDLDEAIYAFSQIMGKMNGIGILNECVLVQEFLRGKEYVIDKVSKNGVHKIVAIWQYEKRNVNGANFVYFGMRLVSSETEQARVMMAYADKVLDALGFMIGPSHMEVMLNTIVKDGVTTYEPCLVEVGARCHGGEGTWLPVALECVGYNMVTITADCYLNGPVWDIIEKDHFPLKKAGREVDMVSRYGGIVRSLPGDEKIRKFASFRSMNWEIKPGDYCPKTIDCFTRPGCVQLVADTEEDAERDLEAIHDLEVFGLIDYSVICPRAPTIGAVVIVDPFSTGANMAATVLKWGYKLILVFSERDSPVAKLVAKGTNVKPTLLVQHDNTNPDQEKAIADTLRAIEEEGSPILAIIPGAETGVELSDHLATRYGTRANGEELTEARRNKFKMQEAVRAAGVRAVVQSLCTSEKDVKDFIARLQSTVHPGEPLKCVVKPNESAGTDSVFLCETEAEAIAAFNAISGQINGLGAINHGALAQEYLFGTEYVVDGISRDGVYKVIAVWEYDKRSVNGANFVYFGMKLRDGNDPDVRVLIDYARQVVNALKLFQGPSHMEVKLNSTIRDGVMHYSPCLVEVGARCHGGEGTWIPVVNECIGYSQAEMCLNCYLRPDRFDEIPFQPTLLNHGCEAFLVSYQSGTIMDIPGIDKIRSLPSFRRCEMMTQPGAYLRPTIDCFTRPGSVQMVNKHGEKLAEDYEVIRKLEFDGLFTL